MQHFYSNCTTVLSSLRTVSTRVLSSIHLLSRSLFLLLALSLSCGVWAADEVVYYANATIQNGSLVAGMNNAKTQFIHDDGKTLTVFNDFSIAKAPSTASIYYYGTDFSELSQSKKWNSSSSTGKTIRGLKFANGTEYKLSLGNKQATSITLYGWCGGTSKTLTIGGITSETSSGTSKTFEVYEFNGSFTGDVVLKGNGGDFYGVLAIKLVSSSTPTTYYTVSFETNKDGVTVPSQTVASGDLATKPTDPTADGYTFDGWYTDNETL